MKFSQNFLLISCLIFGFVIESSSQTRGTIRDSRDGKTYATITLEVNGSTQTWMTENLRSSRREHFQYPDQERKGYAYYGQTETNSGYCPAGFHLPTWDMFLAFSREFLEVATIEEKQNLFLGSPNVKTSSRYSWPSSRRDGTLELERSGTTGKYLTWDYGGSGFGRDNIAVAYMRARFIIYNNEGSYSYFPKAQSIPIDNPRPGHNAIVSILRLDGTSSTAYAKDRFFVRCMK